MKSFRHENKLEIKRLYDSVEPEPPASVIDREAEIFKSEACSIVLGFGGGSSLDVAKGISLLVTNGGENSGLLRG